MSKLYFRYGAMNCGKSTALMQVAHNYEQNNKKILVMKPKIDIKGDDYIDSRIGLKRKVDKLIESDEDLSKTLDYINDKEISCILVDESQFLSGNQIEDLWKITKLKNIPVICYGIKNDFKGELFSGSKRLCELADEFDELITICSCGKRAKFNARYVDGKFKLDGNSILIDGTKSNVEYIPKCGKCFLEELIKKGE